MKTEIITGRSKPMEEVTLDDMLQYPIWIAAIDEECEEEQDETWQKPIINSTDVKSEYCEAYILLKVQNTDLYVSACLDVEKMRLWDIAIWSEYEWISMDFYDEIEFPVRMISIPSINGFDSIEFICLKRKEDGIMIDSRLE
jgi:hypothetical protein